MKHKNMKASIAYLKASIACFVCLAAMMMASCSSKRNIIRTVTTIQHDTLYQSIIRYDSVYLDNSVYVDRKADTVFVRETHLQYKYKVIHDTILSHKADSIPVINTVEVKGDPYVPPWCKWLLAIGAVATIAIIAAEVCLYGS